jgi:hypothetical protein
VTRVTNFDEAQAFASSISENASVVSVQKVILTDPSDEILSVFTEPSVLAKLQEISMIVSFVADGSHQTLLSLKFPNFSLCDTPKRILKAGAVNSK